MNRLKAVMFSLVLLASASLARAAADPVSVEVKWNEKAVQVSTTGVTSFTLDVGGFGSAGYAINGGTQVLNGVDGTVFGATATIVLNSSVTAPAQNVVAFDYSFLAIGSTATLKIAQTLKTPPPPSLGISNRFGVISSSASYNTGYPAANFSFTAPVISTSSAIIEPNNVLVQHTFRAQVVNPIFYLTNLSSAATYFLTVDYGIPKQQ